MIALAGAAALAGALVQSATGFGFALILSPALFAVLDPYEAITTMLLLGPPLNALVLHDSAAGDARLRMLAPVLVAAVPGLVLGVIALELLSKPVLQVAVGAAVVAAALWQIRHHGGRIAAWAAGLASGALTTSISVSGPPVVLWLEGRGVTPGEFRATLAASFLALNVTGGAIVVAAGGIGAVRLDVVLPLLGLCLIGNYAGNHAHRRLAGPRFRLVALALVACTGVASFVAGLTSL
ncbi:MAG: sulfite exporter TauE/SafE family protein [Thermoleophilaceae bacterium]|nr:sulfite exporter TauE/SafE family protein [Thermoleophilaceae bacterium]